MGGLRKTDKISGIRIPNYSLIGHDTLAAALICDTKGNILDANQYLRDMLNYGAGQSLNVRWESLASPECQAVDRERLKELVDSGHAGPWRTAFIDRNGNRIPVLVQAARIPGNSNRFMGLVLRAAEFEQAERELQHLAGKLLKLYDEERRRIARELHDTTAQNLAALSMNLAMLPEMSNDPARSSEVMAECASLTEECLKEVRSLSYMLHPPLLDELGLETALRTFITLYERRTAVTVDLVIGALLGRLPAEVELGVFRIAQESLFNVHRHSGSPRAELRLERRADKFEVLVRDWGKGITQEAARGDSLGIAGMRERVRLLGGELEIGPAGPGTIVRAVFRMEQ
jgi:PAS domain S-box-containing protein